MPEPSVAVSLEGGGLFDGGFVEAVEDLACQVVVERKGEFFELVFGHIKQL